MWLGFWFLHNDELSPSDWFWCTTWDCTWITYFSPMNCIFFFLSLATNFLSCEYSHVIFLSLSSLHLQTKFLSLYSLNHLQWCYYKKLIVRSTQIGATIQTLNEIHDDTIGAKQLLILDYEHNFCTTQVLVAFQL